MQITLFEPEPTLDFTEQLFEAYFDCRRNKRNTINALAFEKHFEHYLFQLKEEILNGSYQPGRSIAFIVDKPVKREIFAADFRDRVVHHWLINKLNPFFEKEFIFDSYACRTAKGTHFGIGRVNDFIRECSKKYQSDCYILKLDIQGFFMQINKDLLFGWLQQFIHDKYGAADKELVLELCSKIIFNDPTKNSVIKGSKQDWKGLPANKSLFQSPTGCGVPIGNLSSQVFANFYLNRFDHYIKNELGIQYYGRYVDDFVIVHPDKEYLKSLVPELAKYLLGSLGLTLHPKKIYLQHYSKGVQFLGTVIKPNRIYIARRTKGNFYAAIQKQNEAVKNAVPDKETKSIFLSSMNSFLGILKHYQTYKLRKRMLLKNLHPGWWDYAYLTGGIAKFVFKRKPTKR